MTCLRSRIGALVLCLLAPTVLATPVTPTRDDEVVETLPTLGAMAAEQRQMRRQLSQHPRDADVALALSRSTLARAHVDGDARLAGQALGVLRAWDNDRNAPPEIRMQRAVVNQYLHAFETAAVELEAITRADPNNPQALLTLATVRRVQARYAQSDSACEGVARAGEPLYGGACLAENEGLRGHFDVARERLQALATAVPDNPGWAAWIRTSIGELELRAGRPAAAVQELQAALALDPEDPYGRLALADALIEAKRWSEARAVLAKAGDSDTALLRRVIVAQALQASDAAALRDRLADRYAQATLRPESAAVHARERAWFALEAQHDPARAVELARINLQTQREPIDFVLLDRAARAAGDAAARKEAQTLARQAGLVDVRLGAGS